MTFSIVRGAQAKEKHVLFLSIKPARTDARRVARRKQTTTAGETLSITAWDRRRANSLFVLTLRARSCL